MENEFESIKNKLNTLRSQYFDILDYRKSIFLLVTGGGRIDYMSESVEDLLQYNPVDLLGRSIFELTAPSFEDQLKGLMRDIESDLGRALNFKDFTLFSTHCRKHYFDGMIVSSIHAGEKKYSIYLHDVTSRRRNTEKLSQTNLELDHFIYKASHDLRAPLLSILGLINLLERSRSSENSNYLHLMKRSVGQLNKFITQLAHYTRNNNIAVERTRIDFEDLFNDVLQAYRFLPNSENIDFQVSVEGIDDTCSDGFRLKIILSNIVSNAIKYHDLTKEAPFIKMVVKGDRKKFTIRVIDNGLGIAEEDLDKIFGMFVRVTDRSEGSGLGLYIVRKAVEQLNANIDVVSSLGEGTEIIIDFPNEIDHCIGQKLKGQFGLILGSI